MLWLIPALFFIGMIVVGVLVYIRLRWRVPIVVVFTKNNGRELTYPKNLKAIINGKIKDMIMTKKKEYIFKIPWWTESKLVFLHEVGGEYTIVEDIDKKTVLHAVTPAQERVLFVKLP